MTKSDKREFLETWIQRVWREEDASAIHEYFVPSGTATGLGRTQMVGPDEFCVLHTALLSLVADVDIEIVEAVEQGDWISYMGVLRCVDRKTGQPIEMTGGAMCLIKDGKMLAAHNAWDFLGFFSQLGLLPADTFGRVLSGESLVGQSSG